MPYMCPSVYTKLHLPIFPVNFNYQLSMHTSDVDPFLKELLCGKAFNLLWSQSVRPEVKCPPLLPLFYVPLFLFPVQPCDLANWLAEANIRRLSVPLWGELSASGMDGTTDHDLLKLSSSQGHFISTDLISNKTQTRWERGTESGREK